MVWYQYIAVFFSGCFSTNAVPHFVYGITGNKFPTPFAKPSGIGLSSPTTNVLWALFNMVVAYLLFTVAPIDRAHPVCMIVFFAGIALMSIFSSVHFQKRDKE